jgi:signal transduction histidine kinase
MKSQILLTKLTMENQISYFVEIYVGCGWPDACGGAIFAFVPIGEMASWSFVCLIFVLVVSLIYREKYYRSRINLFTKAITEGIVILREQKLIYINNKALGIFKITRSDLGRKPIFDLIDPNGNYRLLEYVNLKSEHLFEIAISATDVPETFYAVQVRRVIFRHKVLSVITLTDISRSKEVEQKLIASKEQLRVLNATKDKMMSIIGHDLRGTIGGFSTMLEVLIDQFDTLDSKSQKEMFVLLKETSHSTYNLLENLLWWARSQRGELKFEPTPESLKQIIDENIQLLQNTADNKKIVLKSHQLEDYAVFVDRQMITTTVRNLINNAIKFTPNGGNVDIFVEKVNNQIFVRIKDTGIGIRKEVISELFQINRYFSKKGTNNERGSGLGLVLCKDFVERNGGTISVESEPDKGSIFSFNLKEATFE